MKLDRRVRALGWMLERVTPTDPTERQLIAAQQRQLKRNPMTDLLVGRRANDVEVRQATTAPQQDPLPVRVFRPKDLADGCPLVVHFHGGGWVTGSADMADWLCSNVALAVGVVVISVDYRLAPSHRYPVAVHDCHRALTWAASQARTWGADNERLAIMGESAGGNLAAAVALLARDDGPTIKHQTLLYPALDLTLSSPSHRTFSDSPILTAAAMRSMRNAYLGDGSRAVESLASPLLASDHRGLPATLIQTAEHDPLRDDGARYAESLAAAGVEVRLTQYEGMPHGYLNFPLLCRASTQAIWEITDQLHRHVY